MHRLLLGLVLVAFIAGSRIEKVSPVFGYHESYGIPRAAEIKEAEYDYIQAPLGHRIVGGDSAPVNAYPYLAGLLISLLNTNGQSVCGSSLLTANRLVTAAHCWFDGRNQATLFTVVLGSQFLFYGGTRIATSQVIMHPHWNVNNLNNDVAIIYLPNSISFTSSIQPVALPNGNLLLEQFVGEFAIAAGYGKSSDAQNGVSSQASVNHVQLKVISTVECQSVYGSDVVRSTTICTNGVGGIGVCGGDSGGPLVVRRDGRPVLIGITSFVASNGCQLGFPSGFARVTSFNTFITQHL